ncbi:TPA: hypothetical protein ACP5S6_002839 [Vibrio parahaemolyticus]
MLSYNNEYEQLEKVAHVIKEIDKRVGLKLSGEESIRLLEQMGRAHSIMHKLQLQIEEKNIINHEVALLVDDWNSYKEF